VNYLRTGDFFVAKTLRLWLRAPSRSLCFSSGIATPSARIFHNSIATSIGPLSSNDRRVLFGSGKESKVASIEFRWPGGIVQTDTNVAADQVLKIEEPPK